MGMCLQNYLYLSCYLSETSKHGVKLKLRQRPFIHCLLCNSSNLSNLHNFYEHIKNEIHEWGCTYKINHISVATYHNLIKLLLNQSLDIGLYSFVAYLNHLIYIVCVFMNINKNVKNRKNN